MEQLAHLLQRDHHAPRLAAGLGHLGHAGVGANEEDVGFSITAPVTRPPKDSIIALALPLPRSKPWPPPSWGNTPVRTTVLPASTLATASPVSGLGTMKPPLLGFCFLGLTTATAAVTAGSFFMTAGSFFTFPGFTFPGFTFPGF